MSEDRKRVLEAGVSLPEIREWQQVLLDRVLNVLFAVAIPTLIVGSYYVFTVGKSQYIPFYVAAFVFLGIIKFWKKVPYVVQCGAFLVLIYGLGLLSLTRAGLASNVQVFLMVLPFAATVFLGQRAGILGLAVSMFTMAVFGWLFSTGRLVIPPEIQLTTPNATAWLSYTFTLLLVSAFLFASQNHLLPRFTEALMKSRVLAHELDEGRVKAEENAARTRRQAERMEWAVTLGNVITSIRRRDDLLWRLVREIAQAFDLYQVNFFMADRRGDALTLVAAAGDQGEQLVEEGWQVPVGGHLLPGQAAQVGKEQVALLAPEELPWFPRSRMEVGLPLIVRGELLGVLDLHTAQATFSEEDLQLLRIITGYATAALDMLKLLEESETRVQEMRALYAQQTAASWRATVEAGQARSYVTGAVTEDAVQALAAEAMQALAPRSALLGNGSGYVLAVPLIARDVPLGYLAFTRSPEKGDWDAESHAFIQAAAERLALAMDNTRLLVESRRQAYYAEQIGRVNDVVWRNPDAEIIMEQSVQELGRLLGANEVVLFVNPSADETEDADGA